jgi:hypothetical protein
MALSVDAPPPAELTDNLHAGGFDEVYLIHAAG